MKNPFLPLLFATGLTQMVQAQDAAPRLDTDVTDFCAAFPDGRFEPVLLAGFADTSAVLFSFISEQKKVQVVFADNGDKMLTMEEAVSFSAALQPRDSTAIDYFQLVTLDGKTGMHRYRHANDGRAVLHETPHSARPWEMLEFFNQRRKAATP